MPDSLLALERQVEVSCDLAVTAIRADQIFGIDVELFSCFPVAKPCTNRAGVLFQTKVFRVEADGGSAVQAMPKQDRLKQILSDVSMPTRACRLVIASALSTGAEWS